MNRQKKEEEKKRQLQLLAITPIDSFRDKYRFLSNFFPAIVEFDGRTFQSTEAAYQSAKSLDPAIRELFVPLMANEAKKLGQEIQIRPDWDEVRDTIMLDLLKQKFYQNLAWQRLQATAPRPLVEGNNWHDTYWGVCKGCRKIGPHAPIGENKLGRFLMLVRDGASYAF